MPESIVVLDPDQRSSGVIADALQAWGYDPLVLDRAEGAVEIVRKRSAAAVVLDLALPGMDGLSFCRLMRGDAQLAAIPVIVATASYRDRPIRELALRRYGVKAYLSKPLALGELRTALSESVGALPAQRAASSGKRPGRCVLMDGHLAPELPLATVLFACLQESFYGRLLLEKDEISKTIDLLAGVPVSVESTQRKENLGNYLIDRGLISNAAYSDASLMMVQERCRFGEALVRIGALNAPQAARLIAEHARHKVVNAFLWDGARYRLERRDPAPEDIPPARSTAYEIIVEGVRRHSRTQDLMAEWLSQSPSLVRPGALLKVERSALEEAGIAAELLESISRGGQPRSVGEIYASLRHLGTALLEDLTALRDLHLIAVGSTDASPLYLDVAAVVAMPDDVLRLVEATLERGVHLDDFYALLGVDVRVPAGTIAMQVKAFEMKCQPAKLLAYLPSSVLRSRVERIVRTVRLAADTLMDPEKRAAYDARPRSRVVAEIFDPRGGGSAIKHEDPIRRAVKAELAFKKGEEALLATNPKDACVYFAEASELCPPEAEYWGFVGWALYCRGGDPEKAEQFLRKAVGMDTLLPSATFFLAHLLRRVGRTDESHRLFEQLYARNESRVLEQRLGGFLRAAPTVRVERNTGKFRIWPFGREE